MKKKIIPVIAAALMLLTCGTAFSVDFSIDFKEIKESVKKEMKGNKSGTKQGEAGKGTAGNVAAVNTEPNSEDDFDWEANKDLTEITIKRYKGKRTDVVIPATIQDVPVTKIGGWAIGNLHITSVVIPEGVKVIGKEAFYQCSELVSVTLPQNVSIGESAFNGCSSLKSIDIPKGCQLDEGAFIYCYNLESVTLPMT